MLSQKQSSLLRQFFARIQSQLQKLKISSISPYISNISITDQKQLFYSWGQRRIFHDVKLKQKQIKAINEVKTLIIEQEKFLVNEFSDQVILRHLHSSSLNTKAAYQRLKKLYSTFNPKHNQATFLKYLQKENYQNLQKQLKTGVIYSLGKSSQNSFPLIILQVSKLNTNLCVEQNFALFYLMICMVIQYRMKPHWQQKYIFLIDFGGISFSQIPYTYIYKFMESMSLIFAGMCQKILVYNSDKIGMVWQIVKRILPDHTVSKIVFVDKNNTKDVLQIINPNQLQNKYGGHVDDLKQYWPSKPIKQSYNPHNISKNNSLFKQLQQSASQQDNTTQYFSFKSISMIESIKINNTDKTLGITKKKIIPPSNLPQQEYEIQKQEFFGKLNNFCGIQNKNQKKSNFCKFF